VGDEAPDLGDTVARSPRPVAAERIAQYLPVLSQRRGIFLDTYLV
jgi:hypothetical protein